MGKLRKRALSQKGRKGDLLVLGLNNWKNNNCVHCSTTRNSYIMELRCPTTEE